MLKPSLSVLAGVLLSLVVFAQGASDVELKDGHPDRYVVQKGDTLWDISGRFLTKPWLWPEIWQANPQIENPHLIYPGDEISLVYVDGDPRLMITDTGDGRDGRLAPRIRREQIEPITTVPLSSVQAFLRKPRILDGETIKGLPYVVAIEEGGLMGQPGQLAYVRNGDLAVGDKIAIVRPTYIYREVPKEYWGDMSEKDIVKSEWNTTDRDAKTIGGTISELFRWRAYHRHVRVLGHEVMEIAAGTVTRTGDPSSVLITYGDQEVKAGDLIMPVDDAPFDLTFTPRAPDAIPENMRVLAFTDALAHVGPMQVVALNRGARDGVENGEVFSIYRPGETIKDRVRYHENDVRPTFQPGKHSRKVTLPDEYVGHVMVFRTFDAVSYGLIMDETLRPVRLYDVLREPVN